MPKQPQDHKAKDAAYTFEVGGKTHRLPSAADAAATLPGRFLRDASLDGEEGQLRLGFALLEASGVDPETLDALYDLPSPAMLEHLTAWMSHKPTAEDVSLGESSGSSS